MIKYNMLGMNNVAVNDPTITSESAVTNYSFITHGGEIYMIDQLVTGDDAYKEDLSFDAGTLLRGFLVRQWDRQELIVDGKHITGGVTGLTVDAVLVVDTDGKLKTGTAPTSGVYFKVTKTGINLNEAAVAVRVILVDEVSTGA